MSEKTKHIIDKIARQKLFDTKVDPPALSWERLSEDMDKPNSTKNILLFKRLTAVAATILILLSIGIVFLTQTKTDIKIKHSENLSDSVKIEFQKIKSIALKSQIEIRNKNKLTIISKQIKFEEIPKMNSTDEFQLTYLKLANFIYPIKTESQELSLIAQNNLKVDDTNNFDWAKYEYIEPKELEIKTKKNWKLGLAYSPTYTAANSTSNNSSEYVYTEFDGTSQSSNTNVNEEFLPSFTFGANLSINLSDKWSILSGIYYLKQKNEIQNFYLIETLASSETKLSTNTSIGNIQISNNNLIYKEAALSNRIELSSFSNISNYNSDLIQQFEFIEIPLLISYKLINKKWSISLITGFNAGFLVGNNVYMKNFESDNDKLGSTSDLNTLSLKSVFGFSFEYPLSKRLFLTLAPTYKYQINTINKVLVNNYHFKFIDFKTGISYHF